MSFMIYLGRCLIQFLCTLFIALKLRLEIEYKRRAIPLRITFIVGIVLLIFYIRYVFDVNCNFLICISKA